MRTFKKYLIVVYLFTLVFPIYAQKYRDIFPFIRSDSTSFSDAQKAIVFYIKENPLDANPHYQYGLLCMKHAKAFDVLIETELHLKYLKIAVTEFKLALNYMDEKDVNRNIDYYPEFIKNDTKGKPSINYSEVRAKINQYVAELEPFIDNLQDISKVFNKGVDYYQRARNIYNDINVQYRTLNNLYLLSNEYFINDLNRLINYYDSTIFFINSYKEAIKKFPLEKYNQNFEIKTIETYRLDGFEEKSSFLLPKIVIWNYTEWANRVLAVINNDIADLRQSIDKAQIELSDGINLLKSSNELFSLPQEYKLNKTLVQKVRKFDNNSLMLQMLYFEKNYLDLLISYRNPINNDTCKATPIQKIEFYHKQINQISLCDSLINSSINLNKPLNFDKYHDILVKNYQSSEGLSNYLNSIKLELKDDLQKFAQKCADNIIISNFNFEDSSKYITYKGKKIPLFVSKSDEFKNLEYKTYKISADNDGSIYFCGSYQEINTSHISGFIGKIVNQKVSWIKTIDNKSVNSQVVGFSILNDGLVYLQSCKGDTDKVFSISLIKIDKLGKEKQLNKFESSFIPLMIESNKLGNLNVVVLEESYELENSKSVEIQLFDANLSRSAYNKFSLTGLISDITIHENNIMLIGSCKNMTVNGKTYNNKGNNLAPYILLIDNNGRNINEKLFISNKSVIIRKIFFFDNENVDIIGVFSSKPFDLLPLQANSIAFLKLNKQLRTYYQNF